MTPRERAQLLASSAEEKFKDAGIEYDRNPTRQNINAMCMAAREWAVRRREFADAVVEESLHRSSIR